MEKFAREVKDILEEKLSLYKELQSVLEKEKIYIVDMDVDSLWKIIALKKQIVLKLERLGQETANLLEKRAAELSMDSRSFVLSDFIKKMPVSRKIKSKLSNMKLALETCRKTVSVLASANKKYIRESLVVIDDIFSMAVNNVHKKEYNNSGSLLANKEKTSLFDAEV
ncbi:MAG: flagellar protein FlgN [Desulfobacula sp.]|jgi:flagellar biosynthesis/type III secretory pathway chaperone|nr:flagellar protein FlgN [Desulfobacula sp.]